MRSLIVDGVDTYANLGLVLERAELSPPEPKTYLVDVPGGDGSIDLTDALTGDAAYGDRRHSFSFAAIVPADFEALKTRVSNLIHGRRLDYELSWDPGYVYSGRFSVRSYELSPGVGRIALEVVADPYKTKGLQTYRLNADGGRLFRFECGRKRVQPTIECSRPTRVLCGEAELLLGAGTYRLNDVVFCEGWNELYVNSLEVKTVTWVELGDGGAHRMTWGEASSCRWDEIDQLNVGGSGVKARCWEDMAASTWGGLADATWDGLRYMTQDYAPPEGDCETIIQYEWSDL